MRILGIDPGYATTGFGVLHSSQGQLHLLNYGTITTPAGLTLSRRLVMLYDDMMELLSTVKPDAVAVEELFWGHNVTTGIGVSHGRGVILLAIEKYGAFKGGWLAFKRICRCNPFSRRGPYDPVP